ncbi:MAG: GNAT family N-acetyltransferase [Pseudomonadales bacterium]|nr:GNAT family N-acetyltransferase [Pseudomonadales bacterium]
MENRYPRTIETAGGEITLDWLTDPSDQEVAEFTAGLPVADLLFLSRNIQEPKVLAAWKKSIEDGDILSVVARRQGKVVGTTAVVIDKLSWSPHVGELRILVLPEVRDTGLGRILIQESFLIGLWKDLEKLTVRMTLEQERAITVLEEMGFKSEALFRDHVKDSEGNKHDLLIMSHDVESFENQRSLYGLDQAF